MIAKEDVRTKEVLDWKGIHLFHAMVSSCSQKVRIFLNLKQCEWQSHVVNLVAGEQLTPYYLGINPRGLVPVLIDDGDVHIESNDILLHLERRFPDPVLIPPGKQAEMEDRLRFEDDLHLDLRNLSFRFVFAPERPPKSTDDIDAFERFNAEGGAPDPHVAEQVAYWRNFIEHGVTDDQVRLSARKFRDALAEIDALLQTRPFILGDDLSLIDIAWTVYGSRLRMCNYPLDRLHPHFAKWWDALAARPEFAKELCFPRPPVGPPATQTDTPAPAGVAAFI